MKEGIAMNIVQLNSSLQENSRKRKQKKELNYTYGIVTTGTTWWYIMFVDEGKDDQDILQNFFLTMGYESLDEALSFPEDNLIPIKKSVLITDTLSAQGNFLLHHFIANQLKVNKHVVLVGFTQKFEHYSTIGRKLGVNLTLANQKGTLSFLDGLTSFFFQNTSDNITSADKATTTTNTTSSVLTASKNVSISISNGKEDLQNIYNTIKEVISTRHSSKDAHVSLIFDDLSVLSYSGFSIKDILEFIKACRVLVEKFEGTLITLLHTDDVILEEEEIEQIVLINTLIYQSDYLLSVKGLGSGFSRDISGEINIARGPRNYDKWFRPAVLHYKILDNNVKFFAKDLIIKEENEDYVSIEVA
ncbi:21168_t:CDS:2 [Entrophospora sp. SA101]|nr:21168_t:CDS:2 [Entrophospora sp. SA101]